MPHFSVKLKLFQNKRETGDVGNKKKIFFFLWALASSDNCCIEVKKNPKTFRVKTPQNKYILYNSPPPPLPPRSSDLFHICPVHIQLSSVLFFFLQSSYKSDSSSSRRLLTTAARSRVRPRRLKKLPVCLLSSTESVRWVTPHRDTKWCDATTLIISSGWTWDAAH